MTVFHQWSCSTTHQWRSFIDTSLVVPLPTSHALSLWLVACLSNSVWRQFPLCLLVLPLGNQRWIQRNQATSCHPRGKELGRLSRLHGHLISATERDSSSWQLHVLFNFLFFSFTFWCIVYMQQNAKILKLCPAYDTVYLQIVASFRSIFIDRYGNLIFFFFTSTNIISTH